VLATERLRNKQAAPVWPRTGHILRAPARSDPVVAVHGRALLASGGDVAVLHADLTEPSSILEHPGLLRVLDLSQPVGLICASSLHFVADEADPWGIVARYRDRLCSGSYLAMTHAPARVPGEDPEHDEGNAAEVFRQTSAPLHMRTLAQIRRFFDGFELVAPGVVFMQDWRPDPGGSRVWPVPVIPRGGRPQAVVRLPDLPLRLVPRRSAGRYSWRGSRGECAARRCRSRSCPGQVPAA
jgi:hypothetical protein